MGYNTEFSGWFNITPALKPEHVAYLKAFSATQRMDRDPAIASTLPDPLRKAVGLPIGPKGAYYVGSCNDNNFGQTLDTSVQNINTVTAQPGLWCQWVPSDDGEYIEWDGGEKFYNYVEWIKFLIEHFLGPWGYKLDGKVKWRGEGMHDSGCIVINANVVEVI